MSTIEGVEINNWTSAKKWRNDMASIVIDILFRLLKLNILVSETFAMVWKLGAVNGKIKYGLTKKTNKRRKAKNNLKLKNKLEKRLSTPQDCYAWGCLGEKIIRS